MQIELDGSGITPTGESDMMKKELLSSKIRLICNKNTERRNT